MGKAKVYADFNNADANGRLRLNCVGTIEDLARHGIALRDGLSLDFYSDDSDADGNVDELRVDGVVSFSEEEHCWVAAIDWSALHHASTQKTGGVAHEPSSPPMPQSVAST